MGKETNIFAETNFRNQRAKFGIKIDDRRRHMYIIGKSGMGKTNLIENMIIEDIKNGHGLAFIDPHGESAQKILHFVPKERMEDVIYFCPFDTQYPIAFNPLESISEEHKHLVGSGILEIFKKIWPDVWSARMEYILNNCLMAILEQPNATLLDIMRLLTDNSFREKVVGNLKDPVVKNFWVNEYARYNEKFQVEAIAPIQNKVGQFLTNPIIRNIIGQKKSSFDMRKVMDEGKIFIANLSKGMIGESNSALLGSMLVTKVEQAALSRADIFENQRRDFFLYVDEFQNFATESFANILSEARKYRLSLIMAHQYVAQLPDKVKDGIFGNVGTYVVFRVGPEDAEWLEKEFAPEFMAADIVNLPKYNIYLKLMIDGIVSKAFSAYTLPPIPEPEENLAQTIIENNRQRNSSLKNDVEKEILADWNTAVKNSANGQAKSGFSGGRSRFASDSKKRDLPRSKSIGESIKKFVGYCWICGRETHINFEPDEKRAIYCQNCYDGVQSGKVAPVSRPQHLESFIAKQVSLRGEKGEKEKPELPKKSSANLDELRKSLWESLNKIQPQTPLTQISEEKNVFKSESAMDETEGEDWELLDSEEGDSELMIEENSEFPAVSDVSEKIEHEPMKISFEEDFREGAEKNKEKTE